jgi:uncharacterized membrane protein YqjE
VSAAAPQTPERTLTGLFGDVARDLAELVSHEVRLARIEISEGVNRAMRGGIMLLAGALVALVGAQALLAAAILALAQVVTPWLAALIVGVVVVVIGVAVLMAGKSRLQAATLLPNRTADSVRKDANMIREKFQ